MLSPWESKPQARLGPNNREQLTENREKMRFLTLDKIKAHLRLDDAQATAEEELLEMYGDSAENALINLLHRSYTNIVEDYGEVPVALIHAALMLVDVSYQHRSPDASQSITLVPYTFDLLIKPYMRLAASDNREERTENRCKNL